MLFLTQLEQCARANLLIASPCTNWKNIHADFSSHEKLAYHQISTTKLISFKNTYINTRSRIDNSMTGDAATCARNNHLISKSTWKRIKFCGRNRIALQGHKDGGTSSTTKENLKLTRNLVYFYIICGRARDQVVPRYIFVFHTIKLV